MNLPDLDKTAETIEKWINGSTEDAHLDLCEEAVSKFIERRFFLEPIMPFRADKLRDFIDHKRSKINSLHFITQKP